MKKIKKTLALSLALAMGLSLAACGKDEDDKTTAAPATTAPKTEAATTEAPATEAASTEAPSTETPSTETPANTDLDLSNEGKVLNIYAWNEEFKSRLTDHYPGYTEVDATHGKIGDIDVVWTIVPSEGNAYQQNLDETFLNLDSMAADAKPDLFLVEADYALKYVDTDYTADVASLGITDAEIANQYKYTQDIMRDSKGVLKGLSWQGCPGVLIYNRKIAKEVFGSDDPATVQEYVKDWDAYNETAKKLKEAGYKISAAAVDSYRVFSNNVSSPWVVNDKIVIDDSLMKWVDMSKEQFDAGETTAAGLWSDDWSTGFWEEPGDVFCYFGPAWLINFCMKAGEAGSVATNGGWAATTGPQGFFWGGTWITAVNGTDNPVLVADIMRQLTTNESIMVDIVKKDSDFVNNKPAMEAAATDASFGFDVLGGQNPLAMFCEGAEKIDLSNLSAYDQTCNEEFQNAMNNYFNGQYATKDEAIAAFYKAVEEKHPELSH